jgi:hypothetical protein
MYALQLPVDKNHEIIDHWLIIIFVLLLSHSESGEGKEPRKKYQKAGLFSDVYKETNQRYVGTLKNQLW